MSEQLLENFAIKKVWKKLLKCIESELAEDFLEILLELMNLVFILDKGYRKNIEGFEGRYIFKSDQDNINVSVIFGDGSMKIHRKLIENPNLEINFKNSKALMNFLLSGQDLLSPILHQDITTKGNLNYLSKFGYMAKHLQKMVMG